MLKEIIEITVVRCFIYYIFYKLIIAYILTSHVLRYVPIHFCVMWVSIYNEFQNTIVNTTTKENTYRRYLLTY